MIYLLSSFQWIITFQIGGIRTYLSFSQQPLTDHFWPQLEMWLQRAQAHTLIITHTNIMPFSNLGNRWDLDLLEHPAPQLGHINAYSLGLRSENQTYKLLKQGNRYLLEAISFSHLARIQAQTDSEAVACCHSGVSGCCLSTAHTP